MSTNSSLSRLSRIFFTFGVIPLLLIAGAQLFILSEQTDLYFAWTIPLPFTAAFMGAGYWAALAHAFIIARNPSWDQIRVSIPAGLTATTLLLIATLLHLSQFHLDSPNLLTRFVTWVWIVVYVVTPPIFLYFFVTQLRKSESDKENPAPFPGWVRGGYYLLAAFGLIAGIGLFFFPGNFMSMWAWPLKPLASRAVGAWMTTFGVASASLAIENDRESGAGTMTSLLAFCVLQVVVIFRYSSSMDFVNPLTWGYVLFLLFGIVVNGVGVRKRQAR